MPTRSSEVRLGLALRGHVQEREDVPQVLLGHGRSRRAGRDAQHAGRLAGLDVLAGRPRAVVDGVLEHGGDRPVVLGDDEEERVGPRDLGLHPLHGSGLIIIVVLVVERQIPIRTRRNVKPGGASAGKAFASWRFYDPFRKLPTITATFIRLMEPHSPTAGKKMPRARVGGEPPGRRRPTVPTPAPAGRRDGTRLTGSVREIVVPKKGYGTVPILGFVAFRQQERRDRGDEDRAVDAVEVVRLQVPRHLARDHREPDQDVVAEVEVVQEAVQVVGEGVVVVPDGRPVRVAEPPAVVREHVIPGLEQGRDLPVPRGARERPPVNSTSGCPSPWSS